MRSGKFDSMIMAAALLALGAAFSAQADEPAADTAKGDVAVLYLGKLPITGQQQIVDTLLAIKAALREPLSDSPENANKIVCRINKPLGEAREYLDCARNADYSAHRNSFQEAMLTRKLGIANGYDEMTQQDFDSLVQQQPNHRLHVPIYGGQLLALLDRLPDDAKVVDASN